MGCGSSVEDSVGEPDPVGSNHASSECLRDGCLRKAHCAPMARCGKWNDLMEEAEKGSVAGVKRYLGTCDVNMGDKDCWTALLEACEKKHVQVVDVLLQSGANPNLADKKGWTPIMAAAEGGSAQIAKSLLQAKANVEYQDNNGWTCIMEAAEKGNSAMVRELVNVADPTTLNTKDKRGWSAFMASCEGGNLECVKILWIHGAEHHTDYVEADWSGLYKRNWSAIDEAKQKGHRNIVDFMQPILEAETQLKKMVETDDWKLQDALLYMEKAQQVWCLKGLVVQAGERLRIGLEQRIIDKSAPDREQCFDWLVNLQNNGGNANDKSNYIHSNEDVQNAMVDICRTRLRLALEQNSVAAVKWAIASAVKSSTDTDLSDQMEAARAQYKKLMDIPAEWDIEAMIKEIDGSGRMVHKKLIDDETFVDQMQQFLNSTLRKKYTRDRRGQPVPDALQVRKIVSIQNDQIFSEYSLQVKKLPGSCPLPDGMPSLLTAGGCQFLPALNSKINETWLWHGTSLAAADAITTEDFRLNLAGSNAGTLYGPGIYFSDSCSKSDEYTTANSDGVRCLLLCRVALGRVLYTDAVMPDPRETTQKCLSGEYDCILGDREKCRGTFKEIIVFDDDLAYPEYIIYYKRIVTNDLS